MQITINRLLHDHELVRLFIIYIVKWPLNPKKTDLDEFEFFLWSLSLLTSLSFYQ